MEIVLACSVGSQFPFTRSLSLSLNMEAFLGSWKLTDGGNLEPMVNRLGSNVPVKKVEEVLNAPMTIERDGNGYSMHADSSVMKYEYKFKLGEEFQHATLSGQQIKSLITLERNTLKQVDYAEKPITIESVVEGNKLTMTVRMEDLVAVRHYTKV
uniref:Fatty acid-binding protein homolog 1 n=1 Tax=Schistocephalus solidus TaxID=70667 RepID=A0A0X3PU32_SCHSO